MSNKTILDLNEDCFGKILEYLDLNDYGNFSQVCQRFRQVFVASKQYKRFTIDRDNLKMFFITSENIEILEVDLYLILNILEEHSRAHRQNMFRFFCKQFQNMKALKRLELYLHSKCYEILPDLSDEMVKFLKDLPHFTELKIECYYPNKKYNLNAFCRLKRLTHFRAKGSVDINLKELCKSNENLSYLVVDRYNEGNISDIVPFCRNLKTLGLLSLQLVAYCSALGELPKLQVLKIQKLKNDHELKHMCQKLASTNLLQELVLYPTEYLEEYIYGELPYIDLEETKEICKIKSLILLRCNFKDYECVQYVAQLTNLRYLNFDIRNNSVDFSDSLCHILRECKQMESMWIRADGLPQNFVFKAFKVLEVVRNPQEQKPLELRLENWKIYLPSLDRELYKSYIDLHLIESVRCC